MTLEFLVSVLSVITGMVWWFNLHRSARDLINPFVTFGDEPKSTLSLEERQLLLGEHLKQVKWAFGLLWFAVAIGVIFGSILIGRVLAGGRTVDPLKGGTIALAADLSVAGGAFRLYRAASKQLVKVVETVTVK